MQITDDDDSGTMNFVLIVFGIAVLYLVASVAVYFWIRVQADANHDGKTTQAEYIAAKATLFTGYLQTIFSLGVGLAEEFVPAVMPYDVVATT